MTYVIPVAKGLTTFYYFLCEIARIFFLGWTNKMLYYSYCASIFLIVVFVLYCCITLQHLYNHGMLYMILIYLSLYNVTL